MKTTHAFQIAILVCMGFLFGCTHTHGLPPMMDDFINIYDEEYILDKNDCTNKSAKYARILRENGYEAHMLVMYNEDNGDKRGHCIVVVFDCKGDKRYYCPTNLNWGRKITKGYDTNFIVLYDERFNRGSDAFIEYKGEEE
jgi:hypothetical protein